LLRPGLPRAGVHLALTDATRGVRRRRGPPPRAATPPAAPAHATAEAAPRLRYRRAARRPRHRRRVLLLAAARQGARLRIRCRRPRSPDLEVLQRRGRGGSSASEVRVVPRVAPAAVAVTVTEAPRRAGDDGLGGGRGRREREVTGQTVQKFPEHNDFCSNGTKRSTSSHHRKALRDKFQDKSSAETGNFRLNIPTRSAPTSGFSSPVGSPPRLSNADVSSTVASSHAPQAWSAPSIHTIDFLGALSPRTSPEKLTGASEPSPYSSTFRSPILMPRNTSAPPSPLPKLFPENQISRTEVNGSASLHPLPLPPSAISPMQTSFSNQPAPKVEMPSVSCQWQKGKLLGSGTFGCVYEATNRNTGALCAMKEVNIIPDDAKSAESLNQLEQEIKFLSQFKHENIVQYYGSDTIEDRFYIYLEYVHPGSINKYVKQHYGAITESVVRNFTRHILRGLAFLHGQKIMHRDIKGANLLVDINGVVKLADFGMAKHLSTAAPNLSLKGTPYWMAPEMVQATLAKDVGYDLAVDIWSLGCTIIEMFDGKPPWSDLEGPAAMFKVLHKDPPIPENLSLEGKDFLQCCFKRNPAERPTASELLDHPFIRNSSHYSKHGSIHAFAGIKVHDNGYGFRDKTSSKSEPYVKGRNTIGDPKIL
uniref:mitogen-activated protein kinase kinase kinase n=1 Tax=Aegilops tauschii subsp. strangulata TaxID=200361 RepID=A0A453BP98_AEGTS